MKPTLEVLIEARRLIEAGEKYYICSALEQAGGSQRRLEEAEDLQQLVMAQLEGCSQLEHYIYKVYREYVAYPDSRLRLMRLAWLDKMIADLPEPT